MEKTNINPALVQELLDATVNAADKGQSQFFTPLEFGQRCAEALPKQRRAIVDLNAGAGHLLHAAANDTTEYLLAADIDECRGKTPHLKSEISNLKSAKPPDFRRITRGISKLYPLLAEVEWQADLFVLNPPWSLYFRKAPFEALAHSDCAAAADVFNHPDPGAPKDSIESTALMLAIALDRCSSYGEGFVIGNNNTFERKIFGERAPYAALGRHVWARWVIPGNPMTGLDHANFEREQAENGEKQFATGVLYFARGHETGPKTFQWPEVPDRSYRQGPEVRSWDKCDSALELWSTVGEQVKREVQAERGAPPPFHIWLSPGGFIATHLSRFENASVKVDKNEAVRLHQLNGKRPMQLVVQRADREELLHVAKKAGWRVDPKLIAAIEQSLKEYHAARAPLYPLPEIQRLGYCDEVDFLQCKKDLMITVEPEATPPTEDGGPALDPRPSTLDDSFDIEQQPYSALLFRSGASYPIRTQTVKVTRKLRKPNAMTGEEEDLEYSGQELAMFLLADDGWEYSFMDGNLRNKNTTVDVAKVVTKGKEDKEAKHPTAKQSIDFTLQELTNHFIIPEVPDVATVNPEGYRKNLATIERLEQLTEELNQLREAA